MNKWINEVFPTTVSAGKETEHEGPGSGGGAAVRRPQRGYGICPRTHSDERHQPGLSPQPLRFGGPKLNTTFLREKIKILKNAAWPAPDLPAVWGAGEVAEEEEGEERGKEEQYFYCPYPNKLRCICESVKEASRSETIKSHSCSEGP